MKKLKFIIATIFAIGMVVFFQYRSNITNENVFQDSFNGTVQNVEYSKRERPTVTINNEKIGLYAFGIYRDNRIEVTDSLVKNDTSSKLFHFKLNEDGKQILYNTYQIKK